IIAVPEFADERPKRTKVITVVRIAHDDVLSARRSDASHQSVAVSLSVHRNDAGPELGGDFLRTIGAAVVGDYNFAGHLVFGKRTLRLLNTRRQCLSLVQAGHHDRELDRSVSVWARCWIHSALIRDRKALAPNRRSHKSAERTTDSSPAVYCWGNVVN